MNTSTAMPARAGGALRSDSRQHMKMCSSAVMKPKISAA
jgi:hypothetical protein